MVPQVLEKLFWLRPQLEILVLFLLMLPAGNLLDKTVEKKKKKYVCFLTELLKKPEENLVSYLSMSLKKGLREKKFGENVLNETLLWMALIRKNFLALLL